MSDLISRQAAIAFVDCGYLRPPTELAWSDKDVVDMLKRVPSAQPETHDKRTETHACDLIDRQAAIEAAAIPSEWDGMYIQDLNGRIREAIEQLPSAPPQRIKGRWVRKESDLSWWYECSECGESPLYNPYAEEVRSPFCPWCGAEMQDEQE